jgi:hypothetical protein
MLRILFFIGLVLGIAAFFARSRRARVAFWAVAALVLVYAVLKLTGVIEALAPDRTGVF